MGYRVIEYCGEKYKLTPKWYKQYLTALELMRKVKETNTDESLNDSFVAMLSHL